MISSSPVQEGAAVFSTIDHVQANAEQVLRETVAKWGARDATAIVLDPTTGEMLCAMAQSAGLQRERHGRRQRDDAQPSRHGRL